MGEVINLDEYRPHILVKGSDNAIYMIPEYVIYEYANGRIKLQEEILRAIAGSWIELLKITAEK